MTKRDLLYTVAVSFLIGLFAVPLLLEAGVGNKYGQFIPWLPMVVLPFVCVVGMYIAQQIGKKVPIVWQLAKFALVGVLNTVIDFSILNLFINLTGIASGPSIIPMNAFAFSAAVVNSYFWNKKWVFEEKKSGDFVIFFIVTVIGIALNSAVLFVMTTLVPHQVTISPKLWANLAKVLATGISMVWNYLGYRLVVFKK